MNAKVIRIDDFFSYGLSEHSPLDVTYCHNNECLKGEWLQKRHASHHLER
jgi:hypothetical protein